MLKLKLVVAAAVLPAVDGESAPELLAAGDTLRRGTTSRAIRLLSDYTRTRELAAPDTGAWLARSLQRDATLDELLPRLLAAAQADALSSAPDARSAAQLAQRLVVHAHDDFKRLALARSQEAGRVRGRWAFAEALALALESAWRLLCVHVRTYTAVPEGFWGDCHALYDCALGEGWENRSPGRAEVSLGECYKRLLLLGMTATNRFECEKIDLLINLVEREGQRLTLVTVDAWPDGASGFVFRTDADVPPRFVDADPRAEGDVPWCAVELEPLVHALVRRATTLQRMDQPPAHELQLLGRLRQEWGDPPRRRHARLRQAAGEQVELVSTLTACWRAARLEGGQPEAAAWQLPLEEGEAVEDPPPDAVRLRICNASSSGMLLQGDAIGHPLVAGDLVMVRRAQMAWQLGLVRWVGFSAEGLESQCGVEIIGSNPEAVLCRPVMSHGAGRFRRAFRLKGRRLMIMPGRLYQPLREFLVADGAEPAAVRAKSLVLQTARYQVVEIKS